MAVNYSDLTPGTALVWTASGGDFAMSLDSLTNGTIQQGPKSATLVDATKGFPEVLEVIAETAVQAAPTAGNEIPIYLGFSKNSVAGTENPGGLSGTNTTVGNADQLPQLVYAGSIVLSNALGTGVQRSRFWVVPKAEYLMPVFQNSSGQTTSATANTTKITVRPWYRRTPIA